MIKRRSSVRRVAGVPAAQETAVRHAAEGITVVVSGTMPPREVAVTGIAEDDLSARAMIATIQPDAVDSCVFSSCQVIIDGTDHQIAAVALEVLLCADCLRDSNDVQAQSAVEAPHQGNCFVLADLRLGKELATDVFLLDHVRVDEHDLRGMQASSRHIVDNPGDVPSNLAPVPPKPTRVTFSMCMFGSKTTQ
jgi:hypothetical protein